MKAQMIRTVTVIVLLATTGLGLRAEDRLSELESRIRRMQEELLLLKGEVEALKRQAVEGRRVGDGSGSTPSEQPVFPSRPVDSSVVLRPEGPREATVTKPAGSQTASAPILTAGERGFSVESPDRAFNLRFRSLVQGDVRFNQNGIAGSDTFLVRRARIELTGTLFDRFDFRIMPDFRDTTPTLLDAWLDWRISRQFQVLMGKSKVPVGLERFQSREHNLMTELGYPTSLVPNRDIGIALHGRVPGGSLDYFLGVFNGTTDGGISIADSDDSKTVVARLFTTPFDRGDLAIVKGLGFGIAGTVANDGGVPSGFKTPGQQTFFRWRPDVANDGKAWRLVPQGYYFYRSFGLLGEYAVSSHSLRGGEGHDTIQNQAWQVTASYVLTGEDATFRGVRPAKMVGGGENRGWGAWQLTARVTELDIDDDAFPLFANPDTSASRARSYGGGLNWYLNPIVRISTDYNFTKLSGTSFQDEHVVISRLQFRF